MKKPIFTLKNGKKTTSCKLILPVHELDLTNHPKNPQAQFGQNPTFRSKVRVPLDIYT